MCVLWNQAAAEACLQVYERGWIKRVRREERRGGMHVWLSKGADPTALHIRTKCLPHYLTPCVCVWGCARGVRVNSKSITTNPELKHATRTVSQECTHRFMAVVLCAWVRVCLAERRYVRRRTSSSLWEPFTRLTRLLRTTVWEKWKRSVLWSRNSDYVWASSGQQAASVFQSTTACYKLEQILFLSWDDLR